ncbi:hypothetical protein C8Q77DRAFT_1088182 [Trametes polyzona]|nr:hypothetical protein C8Q77DRAFT_1088182 [Trametes polyzona]
MQRPVRLETVVEDPAPAAGPSVVRSASQARGRGAPEPALKRNKGKGKARSRTKMTIRDKERLRMAVKKVEVQAKPKAAPHPQWSFVDCGCVQLSSSVTEAQVEEVFKRCGTIRRIQIRASAGVAVPTANMRRGFLGFGGVEPGNHYASVEYTTPEAARLALELTGTELDGKKILVRPGLGGTELSAADTWQTQVTFSAANLPETSDVLKSRVAEKADDNLYHKKRALWLKSRFAQLK